MKEESRRHMLKVLFQEDGAESRHLESKVPSVTLPTSSIHPYMVIMKEHGYSQDPFASLYSSSKGQQSIPKEPENVQIPEREGQ